MKEEIGIDINPNDLEVVHVMHRKAAKDERFDFFLVTEKYEGEIENKEPERCDDISWFALDNLPDNIIDYVHQALKFYNDGIYYSEYGWE